MTDETPFTLVNAEFTTEEYHSGTKSIKLNIPADGTSSVKFTFEEPIDLRTHSFSFRLKAIDANVDALTAAYIKFSAYTNIGGPATNQQSSGCGVNYFRPLNSWVMENVTQTHNGNDSYFHNQWSVNTDVTISFTAGSDNSVTLYLDTLNLIEQPAIPTKIILGADDGYLTFGTLAAAAAAANGLKLTCAVTKQFIEDGYHYIGGGDRETMDYDELETFSAAGNEVCNHSKTHPNITGLDELEMIEESITWANELIAIGYNSQSAKVWIPPNGGMSDISDQIIAENMTAQRNKRLFQNYGFSPFNGIDLFSVMSRIYEGSTIEQIDTSIEQFTKVNVFVNWYGHDIHTTVDPPHPYSTHIDVFTYMCEQLAANNIETINYRDLINGRAMISRYTWDYETRQSYLTAQAATFLAANIYITADPLCRYDMEELSTTILYDLTDNNIDGTTTDIDYETDPKRIVKTLSTSKVSLPTNNYIGDSESTVVAAIKVNNTPTAYQGFYFESRTDNGYFRTVLEVGPGGIIRGRWITTTGTRSATASTNTYTIGEWFIAIARRDKTTIPGSSIYRLNVFYQDGRRFEYEYEYVGDVIEDTEPQKIEIFESAVGVGNELGDLIVYKKFLTDADVLAAARSLGSKYSINALL